MLTCHPEPFWNGNDMDPLIKFRHWLSEELEISKDRIPSACCLSTIGTDGYPNARFVALKELKDNNFIITGSLSSRKGMELALVNQVALTFWWTASGRQIRIQGRAKILEREEADKYFAERNRESQIVSMVSQQGQPLPNPEVLNRTYEEIKSSFADQTLPRPEDWGGYAIEPLRIEFLDFKPTRFHDRILYERINGEWKKTRLQP